MVKALDAGDVLGSRTLPIDPDWTAREVHDRLAQLSVELLHLELMDFIRGNLVPQSQDESQVSYAKKIAKIEGEIDWRQGAMEIHNKVRAFVLGPGTWTTVNGKKVKIHRTQIDPSPLAGPGTGPGTVADVGADAITVVTGKGLLRILEVQPESRSRMSVADFLRGNPVQVGLSLGGT
jgi:methionyl-tRNA formyltransferase